MPPAQKTLKYTQISKETFKAVLSRYPSTVPENLRELDALRYDTIPATVTSRKKKGAYLTKDEAEKLVEWKLYVDSDSFNGTVHKFPMKHGTFRPKLLQLVQSNAPKDIEQKTRNAFSDTPGENDEWMHLHRNSPLNALEMISLKVLTKLKGIGPATASLLLSTNDPTLNPFLSDELFRWLMWDIPGKPGGWNRVIRYNVKEYQELLGHVNKMRTRLGVTAVDMEKVAWVLGKEGVDVGKDEQVFLSRLGERDDVNGGEVAENKDEEAEEGSGEAMVEDSVPAKKDGKRKFAGSKEVSGGEKDVSGKVKKGAKRKVVETEAPAEGVRRSSRRKTAP
ncbi:uncharacterized protein N0V89_002249 [Didymosphaeria variabile]|uniref:Uncharacterized protein n=1 Tax=Didymosphaeria variabile TaxID=1932322 RepID=A0A9W8XT55_9PLEO|nr:uncharacterized protein N0V89_002249 [Didymosphaeria variabile]KAJ4357673.1 hypothetical protein N0V89_002249 [Didymosphaeria variabile]